MRKSTTAISAGALSLALSGGTALLVATPATASSLRVWDCGRGGDVLSGLTGGVCDLLGETTGVVNHLTDTVGELSGSASELTGTAGELTGTASEPTGAVDDLTDAADDLADNLAGNLDPVADTVTDTADKTTDKVLGGSDRDPSAAAPTDDPGGTGTVSSDGSGDAADSDLVEIDTGCLPVLSTPDCDAANASPQPAPSAGGDRSKPPAASIGSAPHRPKKSLSPSGDGPVLPRNGPVVGVARPGDFLGRAKAIARPAADVDTPPLTPLWPGQPLPVLTDPLGTRHVMPSRRHDAVGTALTAVLLTSAILAARVVQARRRHAQPPSMPFEGIPRQDPGRHRLA